MGRQDAYTKTGTTEKRAVLRLRISHYIMTHLCDIDLNYINGKIVLHIVEDSDTGEWKQTHNSATPVFQLRITETEGRGWICPDMH